MADGINVDTPNFNDEDFNEVFSGKTITDILGKFGNDLQTDLVTSLAKKGKNASGALSQSITFKTEVLGETFTFALSMADYYDYVDKGRLAGKQPPLSSIIEWVRTKSAFGLDVSGNKEINGVAFAIARKIGKFGIKPTNFFTDVIDDGRVQKLSKDLERVLGDSLKGLILKN